ncbi:uncharacterized protein LOC111615146 [Centruroides sculpturatus]|uniref:uncharacterized protein LOC111615146 n=1 Tax=Centruroides sculpturatus TaxID=218467 RepID=UPI000C6EFA8E|nr:uncharacterized protein LOC111615146 [Centruroides sculpturatus]
MEEESLQESPVRDPKEVGLDKLKSIKLEAEKYMEENPNSKFGTKIHAKMVMDFFDQMIGVYADTFQTKDDQLQTITRKIDMLLDNSTKKPANTTLSYADKVKVGPTPHHCSSTVVIIESTDHNEDAETIKTRIKSKLDPRQLKLGVKQVRKIRNRGLLVELEGKDKGEHLINEINNMGNLTARLPKKILPKVTIFNIPASLNKQDIIEGLFDQNEPITKTYQNVEEFGKNINIKSKFGRKPEVNHWICEVTPDLRKLLLKLKKVNLDWVRCSVEEYYSIIQCYKCCKYGHIARECSSDRNHCNHCGGDHRYSECKNKNTAPNCINCIRNKSNSFAHRANHPTCAERQKIIRAITSRTDYG